MSIERGGIDPIESGNHADTGAGDTRVAVYGTLKRGLCNHHVMGEARFLGEDTLSQITLYDLGPYPGAVLADSRGIDVEVFSLDAAQLALLDRLEEYNEDDPGRGLYTRLQLATRFGPAWVYLYQGSLEGYERLDAGAWSEATPTMKEVRV